MITHRTCTAQTYNEQTKGRMQYSRERQYRQIALWPAHAVALCAISTPAAFAQEDASDTGAAVAGALEEIVVSAQRRTERLQDVPIAVTAMTAEELEQRRVSTLFDVLRTTPNVSFTTNGGNEARADISIRGIGNQGGAVSPFALYVDDFSIIFGVAQSLGSARAFDANLFDFERVEVLRGPQGTYFGKNALGGAINVITKKPEPEFGGTISADYALEGTDSYDGPVALVKGSLNLPISDRFLMRVNGYGQMADGYINDLGPAGNTNDREEYGGRVAAHLSPTDAVTIDLQYLHSLRERGINSDIGSGRGLSGLACQIVGVTGIINIGRDDALPALPTFCPFGALAPPYGAPIDEGVGFFPDNTDTIATNRKGKGRNETDIAIAKVGIEFDSVQWTTVAGWLDNEAFDNGDVDGTTVDFLYGNPVDSAAGENYSLETRLSSDGAPGSPLTWQFGVIYGRDISQRRLHPFWGDDPRVDTFLPPTVSFRNRLFVDMNSKLTTKSYAAFGEADYALSERLIITAGGRYTHDTVTAAHSSASDTLSLFSPAFNQPLFSLEKTFSDFSPKISMRYKWSNDILTYATAAKGYKAGGYNLTFGSTPTNTLPFDEETLWNYELGFKSELIDHRLRLNAAVFYMDWKNIQVATFDPQTLAFQVRNAAKGEARGFELEMTAVATSYVQVGLNYGFNDAQYEDFRGCQSIIGSAGAIVRDCSGMPFGIRHQVGAFGQIDFPVGPLEGYLRTEYSWRSKQNRIDDLQELTDSRATPVVIGAYDVVNFRAGIAGQSWRLDVYAENAIGSVPAVGDRELFTYLNGEQVSVLPRQLGLRWTYDF